MANKPAVKRASHNGHGWVSEAGAILERVQFPADLNKEASRIWKTLRERWQRLASGLRRQSKAFSRDVQKQLRWRVQQVRSQAQPWIRPLEKNAQEVAGALRKRSEQLGKSARREAHRVLVRQFEVAPRKEVEQLRLRVAALEKQLQRIVKQRKEKETRPAPTSVPPPA